MILVATWRRAFRALTFSMLVAAAAPLAAQAVFADAYEGTPCSSAAWSATVGSGAAGGPADATPIARYAGRCAFKTVGVGYTEDTTPNAELMYRARFYVRPEVSAGSVFVFEALDDGGTPEVALAYDPLAAAFTLHVEGITDISIPGAPPNAWYYVEIRYHASNIVSVSIQGAGAGALAIEAPSTIVPSPPGIGTTRIGWIAAASGAPVGAVTVDDFVSTRALGPIGPLCRGDANGNGLLDQPDYRAATDEILARTLAPGTPDCNEDGRIDAIDRVCIAKRIGGACP